MFDSVKDGLTKFLSETLNEQKKNIEPLADILLILGVNKEIFYLAYLLKPALEIMINESYLVESSRHLLSNDYFLQPEDKYDVDVLMKYPVFGFNYKEQKYIAYKYYSGLKISDRRKVFLSKLRYEILREIGGSDEQNEAAVYSRTEDKDCA